MASTTEQQLTLTDDQTPGQSSLQQSHVTSNNATVNLPSQQKLTLTDDQTPGQSSLQQGQVTSNNATVNLSSLEQLTLTDDQTPGQSSLQQGQVTSNDATVNLSSQQPTRPDDQTPGQSSSQQGNSVKAVINASQMINPIFNIAGRDVNKILDESDDLNQHVRKYVDLLKTKKYDEAKSTRQELSKLLEGQQGVTANDLKAEATKRKNGGEYLEAILFFNIAADFYAKQQNPEVATAYSLVVCASEIKETIKLLMENSDLFSKTRNIEIVQNYVIPLMFDITQQIRNLQINEEIRCEQELLCLNCIERSQRHIGDLASSEKTLKLGIQLMETKFGNESLKYPVYGHLLNDLGSVYENTSRINEAIKYFTKAIEVFKTTKDLSDEERGRCIANSEEGLQWCKAELNK